MSDFHLKPRLAQAATPRLPCRAFRADFDPRIADKFVRPGTGPWVKLYVYKAKLQDSFEAQFSSLVPSFGPEEFHEAQPSSTLHNAPSEPAFLPLSTHSLRKPRSLPYSRSLTSRSRSLCVHALCRKAVSMESVPPTTKLTRTSNSCGSFCDSHEGYRPSV